MDRNKKNREDDIRGAEKDIQPILTTSTDASSECEEPQTPSPQTRHCKPDVGNALLTPNGKSTEITYEGLGLTPTEMKPMTQVLAKMAEDGAWDIYAEGDQHEDVAFRLIVFLYGKGYYDDLPKEERVNHVKACISQDGGNRKRLRDIAFPRHSHRMPRDEEGFQVYFQMASTARMLFERKNASGGFPREAYYRVQDSNNCYLVAACMWLTIKLQEVNEVEEQHPIDIGYIGRRHVIHTREGLEQRVIRNKGANVVDIVVSVIGSSCGWVRVNCNFSKIPKLESFARTILASGASTTVGLISQFHTCDEFKKCAAEPRDEYGYWKFDGDSIDCVGEFVTMEADGKIESERERLRGIWEQQLQRAEEAKKSNNDKMKEVIRLSPRSERNLKDTVTESEPPTASAESRGDPSSGGTHAMVMLGVCKEEVNDETKHFYVLWNWWPNMPLVLVSLEYLVACQCEVYFWTEDLNVDLSLVDRNDALFCDCDFPDHAENTVYKEKRTWVDGRCVNK